MKHKAPKFRRDLISDEALAEIGMTITDLASECRCTVAALRKYRSELVAMPGGKILGYMSQALVKRGVSTSAGHLAGVESPPV